jgi:hypothetical protein
VKPDSDIGARDAAAIRRRILGVGESCNSRCLRFRFESRASTLDV